MKITVPPLPTDGIYAIRRTALTAPYTAYSITRFRITTSRRTARRHIGRAIRRDYFPPVVRELHDFQLHALGAGIRHAVEASR